MERVMAIRVLFADSEERLLAVYRRFFARIGFEVATVSSGAACFNMLNDWRPDAMVFEPDMCDAWADRIALLAKSRDVPLLILSRRDRYPITSPVWEYHVKPASMKTIARSIRAALQKCKPGLCAHPPFTEQVAVR